ncbi:MAG: hypothetical protein ABIK28_01525 [Planctomycetota bacterium]
MTRSAFTARMNGFRMLWILSIALCCGCAIAPAPGPAPLPAAEWNQDIDASLQIWRPTISGKLKVGSESVTGTNLGLRDELGFDRYEVLNSLNIKGYLDTNWFLDLNYVSYDQTGHSLLDHDVYYAGQMIPSGSTLSSSLDFSYLSLNLGRKLYSHRGLTYGVKAGLLGIKGESDIATESPPATLVGPFSSHDDWTLLMPAAGAFASYLTRQGFEFSGDVQGTFIKYRNSKAHYLDAEGRLAYYFADNIMAYLGYHYIYLDTSDDDIDFFTRLKGPTLGFTFRF